ncbi:MAG: hypothetical protein HY509_04120 [Acidobacteria bacterium]|nr:hypothetical protein [Acidobacteriota bacterium]
MKRKTARSRGVRVGALALLALAVTGCEDQTIISSLVDCGLERIDLTGTWNIQFTPATADFFNCSTSGFVTVDDTVFPFGDISVFASAGNVGFQFQDSSIPNIVFGNVEADSCLMLISFLDDDDGFGQYLQCIGTFDRATGTMQGACDSTTLFAPALDDCDLDPILFMSLAVF